MTKVDLAQIARGVRLKLSEHSPEILMGIGVASMITTTILAVKTTPKAVQLLEEAKDELGTDELKPVEVVKATWKCYIPAAVSGVFGVACLVGANSVHVQRNAALATMYKISETALTEYRDKVVETIGEKKETAIREKVAEKRIEESPVSKNEVYVTSKGTTLCFDGWSGRYFESCIEEIKKAENTINKRMLHQIGGCASLNEFYDEIGLERVEVGDMIGWNVDNLVDIHIGATLADDGRPCVTIIHNTRPIYEYDR